MSRSSGSGSGLPLPVAADLGGLVALAQRAQDRLELGRGEAHAPRRDRARAEAVEERLAVLVEGLAVRLGEARQELADRLLALPARLDLGEPRLLVLLLAGGEVREAALVVEARDRARAWPGSSGAAAARR